MEQLYAVALGIDLTGQIGRFVRTVPGTTGIGVNTAPGTRSLGVLKQIESVGGIQIAVVVTGALFPGMVTSGVAITRFAALANDAAGRAVAAVAGDVVSGRSERASVGATVDAELPFDTTTDILPSNPKYYVASTGNDGPGIAGSPADPFASVARAFQALRGGYSDQAEIIVVDAVTEPAGEWITPRMRSGSKAVLLQGTLVDSGLGPLVLTGGTTGAGAPPVLATMTTGVAMLLNEHQGKRARFTVGPHAGQTRMIHSNDVAGVLTVTGIPFPVAPGGADTIVIENYVGQLTVSSLRVQNAGGAVWMDKLEIVLPVGARMRVQGGTWVQTGNRYITSGAGATVSFGDAVSVESGGDSKTLNLSDKPATALFCGNRWDGVTGGTLTIGTLGVSTVANGMNANMTFYGDSFGDVNEIHGPADGAGHCVFDHRALCGFSLFAIGMDAPGAARILIGVIDLLRAPTATVHQSGLSFRLCDWELADVEITNTAVGENLIDARNARGVVGSIVGANPLALVPLVMTYGSSVRMDATPTVSGGVGGSEVAIDNDPAFSWANASVTLAGALFSGAPSSFLRYSGGFTATGGADTGYFANILPDVLTPLHAAIDEPVPQACRVMSLRVKPSINTLSAACVFAVLKNGAPTGITVNVGAGSIAETDDITHTDVFAVTDRIDLQAQTTSLAGGTFAFAAMLKAAH